MKASNALVLVSLSAVAGLGCKKLQALAGAGDAGPASSSSAAALAPAPVVESGPKSFVPLLRDCAAGAVVFDVGGRAGVVLSRRVDPKDTAAALALTYATWDAKTATWTDEPIPGVTAEREVHEVTAEGTWDNPRLRIIHGNAAQKDDGGHRTFWSLSSDGTVPAISVEKKAGAWTSTPVEVKPGPMPNDNGRFGGDGADEHPKASMLDKEQTKLVAKSPGCGFFPESMMGAPKGWAYGHLSGTKCRKPLAVVFHQVTADRGETFTWPAKKDAPATVLVRVLGADTYFVLMKQAAPGSPIPYVVDKLLRLDGSKTIALPVPPEPTFAKIWKHGDELRAGGLSRMWRLRDGKWEAFGPGGCLVVDDTAQVQLASCVVSGIHYMISVADAPFVDLPTSLTNCSTIAGHETAFLQCGSSVVELVDGKPGDAHPLPAGVNDEPFTFAGGALWVVRNGGASANIFRLGSVGKSVSCAPQGALRLMP